MDMPTHPDTLHHQMQAYRNGLEQLRGLSGPIGLHLLDVFNDFALTEMRPYHTERLTEFACAVTRTVPSGQWLPSTVLVIIETLLTMDQGSKPHVYLGLLSGQASVLWQAYRILLAAYPDIIHAPLLFDLLYGALQANNDEAAVTLSRHLVEVPATDFLCIRVRSVLSVARAASEHVWPAEVVSLLNQLKLSYNLA